MNAAEQLKATQCDGKDGFLSIGLARRVARNMRRRGRMGIGSYRCSVCRKFHVGSQELR